MSPHTILVTRRGCKSLALEVWAASVAEAVEGAMGYMLSLFTWDEVRRLVFSPVAASREMAA